MLFIFTLPLSSDPNRPYFPPDMLWVHSVAIYTRPNICLHIQSSYAVLYCRQSCMHPTIKPIEENKCGRKIIRFFSGNKWGVSFWSSSIRLICVVNVTYCSWLLMSDFKIYVHILKTITQKDGWMKPCWKWKVCTYVFYSSIMCWYLIVTVIWMYVCMNISCFFKGSNRITPQKTFHEEEKKGKYSK